jgi:hypothetical protein
MTKLNFEKMVINGKNKSVVNASEFMQMYKNHTIDTDVALKCSDYVLPYSDKYGKASPYAIPTELFIKVRLPMTDDEKKEYSIKNIVNFGTSDSFQTILDNVYKIKQEKNAGLSVVNDCLSLEISDDDAPELRAIKQAINDKHIDADSYRSKFPSISDYNNDMRALKSNTNHTISFFKAKRILDSFDMEGVFIIKDKKDACNPTGKEYTVVLTEEE